ncbi:hypothetical protein [Aneurinibacillus soli]|nr:hypothetical protein [Aneurinibacillus soli]
MKQLEMNVDDNPLIKMTELYVKCGAALADVQEARQLLSDCSLNPIVQR